MSKRKTLPLRTTVSLRSETARRLDRAATTRKKSAMDLIREAVEQFLDTEPTTEDPGEHSAMAQAAKLVAATRGLTNPYQDIVGAWRLARTVRQMYEIRGFGFVLDVYPPEQYLLNLMSQLFQRFGPLDEFLVVTDIPFWTAASVQVSHRAAGSEPATMHLEAQKNAIAEGMGLTRVFQLASANNLRDPAIESHRQFLLDLKRAGHPVDVRYRIIKGLGKPGHPRQSPFACIRRRHVANERLSRLSRDNGCLVIEPVYEDGFKAIRDLRFLFSHGSGHDDLDVKPYLDRFFHIFDQSQSLDADAR